LRLGIDFLENETLDYGRAAGYCADSQTESRASPVQDNLGGFFGDYRVTAAEGGRAPAGTFSFEKTTAAPIEVRLIPQGQAAMV
jgi:hypothetical protein